MVVHRWIGRMAAAPEFDDFRRFIVDFRCLPASSPGRIEHVGLPNRFEDRQWQHWHPCRGSFGFLCSNVLMMGLSSGRHCASSNVTATGYRVPGSDRWFVHAPGSCREFSVLLHVDNRISSGNTGAAAGRSESVRFLRLWIWTLLSRCL